MGSLSGGLAQRMGFGLVPLALAVLPQAGMAQRTVEISDRPTCPRCEIQRTPLPALGDESGDGIIESEFSRAVQDSRGRVYLAGPHASQILVFDQQGRFVRRIGRLGGGPGEFNGIGSFHVGPGDSLFVFDNQQSRLSVFTAEGAFVRSLPVPVSPAVTNFVASDGRFIIGRSFGAPELGPHPLHLFDREGRRLRSFGNFSGEARPDVPGFLSRSLAPASGPRPRIWSGHWNTYVIDRIALDTGTRDLVVRRTARWFPARREPPRELGTVRPDPGIGDIQEDEAGRLWVLLSIPDPEWRAVHRPAGPGDSHDTVTDQQGFYDTRIEVLDLKQGRLIAALEIPEHVGRFSGPQEIGLVVMEDGVPRFHRWRLTLSVPD